MAETNTATDERTDAPDTPIEDKSTDEIFESLRRSEDEPPDRKRSKRAKRTTRAKATGKGATDKQIRDQLNGTLGAIGAVLAPFDPWCGVTILEGADKLAESLIEVSKSNPRIRRTLESFVVTSTWGTFLGAAGAVAVPVLAHHTTLIPGSIGALMGPDPDTLAAFLDGDTDKANQIIASVVAEPERQKPEPKKPTQNVAPIFPEGFDNDTPPTDPGR